MDSSKEISNDSRYIDLGLPADKKSMSLLDYKAGKRWGWVKQCRMFEVDYDIDIKERERDIGDQPENCPKSASSWMEEYAAIAEKKESNKGPSFGANPKKSVFEKEKKEPIVGDKTVALGTKDEVYATGDAGLLGAVLEAYNHHWNLKISPDDFWIPVAIRVGRKINDNAKEDKVRDFFVDFEGKKEIVIESGASTIYQVDYIWLFEEFSQNIKNLIKKPEYNDLMTASFSTSTPITKIASQINIMSSLQEYFEFTCVLGCGIKGVEMTGNKEDWKSLITKIDKLTELLSPLEDVLKLSGWLKVVRGVYEKLLATFEGTPDKNWWSKIISKVPFGSGSQKQYEGWIVQFLEGKPSVQTLSAMQSSITSVPMKITYDQNCEGEQSALVAGPVGFTIEEGNEDSKNVPTIRPYIGWALLLPKNSGFR
ncbi:uncharacterized protein [Clytia hemisphaerica]|uniref:uncharacterized protein n=1 Tax=Clytia hemisphaerica TaxID=252671 RepID=UPI0034D5E746